MSLKGHSSAHVTMYVLLSFSPLLSLFIFLPFPLNIYEHLLVCLYAWLKGEDTMMNEEIAVFSPRDLEGKVRKYLITLQKDCVLIREHTRHSER